MHSTNILESIDKASHESEEYLAILLVRLLKRLGKVDVFYLAVLAEFRL